MSKFNYEQNAWTMPLRVLEAMTKDHVFHTAYLWGPPGIGKTWAAYETAPEHYAITLTEETPMSELRGGYMLSGGEQIWADGPAIKAMRKGCRLVLNEISHAGPDAQSFLFPILESAGTCKVTLPTGETVKAAEGFNVVGTDNCTFKDLPEALQNRWNVKFYIDCYSPKGLLGLSERWRSVAEVSTLSHTDGRLVSLRDWYSLEAAESYGFTLDEAAKMVFGGEDGELMAITLKTRFRDTGKEVAEPKEGVDRAVEAKTAGAAKDDGYVRSRSGETYTRTREGRLVKVEESL